MEFVTVMKLIETSINRNLTTEQATTYFMLLGDLEYEEFLNGVKRMLQERVYTNIPSPAEIREYCLNLKENDLNLAIEEAKRKIKGAISRTGSYRCVCFDDPVIHIIIENLGGWKKICGMDISDFENFFKFEFSKIYKAYKNRENREVSLFLTGISYSEDKKNEIHFIGDKDKIDKWHKKYIEKKNNALTFENQIKANMLGYSDIQTIEKKDFSIENKGVRSIGWMLEEERKK